MSDKMKRVAVTGVGAFTPLGATVNECWSSILAGKRGFRYVDLSEWNIKTHYLGIIDGEPDLSMFPAAIRRRLPRHSGLLLAAAREAIGQAFGDCGSPTDHYLPQECGVITGTGWGSLDEAYASSVAYGQSRLCSPFSCFMTMNSASTAACSLRWKLEGYQNSVSAACATGAIATGDAYRLISSGRMKMMLAGAAESLRSHYAIWSVDVLGALSTEKHDLSRASCPFSAGRSGFVLSEGGAVLVLEELESAIKRGATVLGEIRGYAENADAFDITMPEPEGRARIACIRSALDDAGLLPSEIDYINAHGTSTPLNDRNETQVIRSVFGEHAYDIPVSSTKGHTGHLIAAAGTFEAIICVQALRKGIIPPTANLNEPDPECDLDYVAEGPRKQPIHNALTVSFGFGGSNAALVISRWPENG